MHLKKIPALLLILILATAGTAAAVSSPTQELRNGVEKILDLLKDKNLAPEVRNQKIEDIVRKRFDFNVMSQWILGIYWRKASPQERDKFKDLFKQLLEATYKGRIGEYAEQYSNEHVEYAGERIVEDRALVDTFVVTKDKKIPISYKMIKQGDEWKIYDVVIEEVSLVLNYRNTYQEIVRKEGLQALFKRMEEKIAEIHSGKAPPESAAPVSK